MQANRLSPGLWNAILSRVEKASARTEFVTGRVVKSDAKNRLVWVREFADTPIPLVGFKVGFSYYDTQETGVVQKRQDLQGEHSEVVTPRKGALVVVVRPFGNLSQPFCIGEVLSSNFWEQ